MVKIASVHVLRMKEVVPLKTCHSSQSSALPTSCPSAQSIGSKLVAWVFLFRAISGDKYLGFCMLHDDDACKTLCVLARDVCSAVAGRNLASSAAMPFL